MDLQDIIYNNVYKDMFFQVMRELKGVADFQAGSGRGDPDRVRFDIEWMGYTPKDGVSLEPFFHDESQWDVNLCFRNPHFRLYVPSRLFELNKDNLSYTRKREMPQALKKCKCFKKLKRMYLYYTLDEYD